MSLPSRCSRPITATLRRYHLSGKISGGTFGVSAVTPPETGRRPLSTPSFPDKERTVLVLGSSGCLGSALASHLSSDLGMTVIGADVVERARGGGAYLDAFLKLPSDNPSLAELTKGLCGGLAGLDEQIRDRLENVETGIDGESPEWDSERAVSGLLGLELDAIVCANGGWEGDISAGETDEAFGDSGEKMLRMNLHPVLAAGRAASSYMADRGLFVAIGAAAALSPTPTMASYGASKTAVHHYIQTMGAMCGPSSLNKSKKYKKGIKAIRKGAQYLDELTATAILPGVIDTPANRTSFPSDTDYSEWVKSEDISQEIGKWLVKPHLRPHSGSLIKMQGNRRQGEGAFFQLVR